MSQRYPSLNPGICDYVTTHDKKYSTGMSKLGRMFQSVLMGQYNNT